MHCIFLNLGTSEELFLLLRDYLFDRTQRVRINTEISTDKRINSGVPQGSVLGPLLFLLYLKDLPTVIFSSQVLLFADDLKLIDSGQELNKLLSDLENPLNWSIQNCLFFNFEKRSCTDFLIARKRKNEKK